MQTLNLRARVFFPVFALACIASLAYVFSRPAVYFSSARLQIEAPPDGRLRLDTLPGAARNQNEARAGQREIGGGDHGSALLTEAQALTSGALLDQVAQQLKRSGAALPNATGSVDALRDMLSAVPVAGTNVIELRGEGNNREALPQILGTWIDVYRQSHVNAYGESSAARLDEMRGAVEQLRHNLVAKRQAIEQFRRKTDIVSLESEQNASMAALKGLNTALSDARNREVSAEARLHAVRENVAAGRGVVRPDDKTIIADLEGRAIKLRDSMKDLENDYSPAYLAIDPKYRSLRANLTRLEQQIVQARQASTQQAVYSAEEELASARQTALRLQQDLAGRKRGAQDFTTQFAEHSALANEVRRLEASYDAARERLTQLEIENKSARPAVMVMSQPSVPDSPLRPDYWRDALIAIAGAGVLGLAAVWLVEFFMRSGVPQPAPATQPIIQIAFAPNGMPHAIPLHRESAPHLLEASVELPRELSGPEVHALCAAASPDARLVITALFGGLSIAELTTLRYADVDFDAGRISLAGAAPRSVALRDPLQQLLRERQAASSGSTLLADTHGIPLSGADIEGLIACAACDAGLSNPTEVNSDLLRHTYAAYLVRQGARLADIGGIVGHIAPAAFREYGRLSPPGPGLPLERIDPVFPALRPSA